MDSYEDLSDSLNVYSIQAFNDNSTIPFGVKTCWTFANNQPVIDAINKILFLKKVTLNLYLAFILFILI